MERPNSFQEVEQIIGADSIRPLSCSEALRNRGVKYYLFTPALLLTHGGFDRDPVVEFDARYNLPDAHRPFCVQLRRDHERFFAGLGMKALPGQSREVNWDQRIYAIEEEYAGDCFEFIGGIAYSDPKNNMFAEIMSYDVMVPDPTSHAGEFLTIKVFGVMANTFIAYMQERPGTCPIARRVPFSGGALPANMPRTNLLGVAPKEDPLKMREGD
jgi:hypothetical protein